MQERLALALDQMVYAAELAVTYVEGLDRDSFYADQKNTIGGYSQSVDHRRNCRSDHDTPRG